MSRELIHKKKRGMQVNLSSKVWKKKSMSWVPIYREPKVERREEKLEDRPLNLFNLKKNHQKMKKSPRKTTQNQKVLIVKKYQKSHYLHNRQTK